MSCCGIQCAGHGGPRGTERGLLCYVHVVAMNGMQVKMLAQTAGFPYVHLGSQGRQRPVFLHPNKGATLNPEMRPARASFLTLMGHRGTSNGSQARPPHISEHQQGRCRQRSHRLRALPRALLPRHHALLSPFHLPTSLRGGLLPLRPLQTLRPLPRIQWRPDPPSKGMLREEFQRGRRVPREVRNMPLPVRTRSR